MNGNEIKTFGQVVRAARRAKKMSQQELSYVSDLDRTFISQIETGKKQPSLLSIFQLGQALQIRPSSLLYLVERALRSENRASAS